MLYRKAGTREHGTRKNTNAIFAFLRRDDTVMMWKRWRGEVEGGDCGRDMRLTPNRLPAIILLHRAHVSKGGCEWRDGELTRPA